MEVTSTQDSFGLVGRESTKDSVRCRVEDRDAGPTVHAPRGEARPQCRPGASEKGPGTWAVILTTVANAFDVSVPSTTIVTASGGGGTPFTSFTITLENVDLYTDAYLILNGDSDDVETTSAEEEDCME